MFICRAGTALLDVIPHARELVDGQLTDGRQAVNVVCKAIGVLRRTAPVSVQIHLMSQGANRVSINLCFF